MSDDESKGTLLLVDDEPSILKALRRLFVPLGYEVHIANNGQEGLDFLEGEADNIDLIISDMRMPVMDGAAFLKEAAQKWPDIKRVLLTGYSDSDSTLSAIKEANIDEFLDKPWMDDELEGRVCELINQAKITP
jgi:response regulator RpfG family c-di-GMP phosphodiesterase